MLTVQGGDASFDGDEERGVALEVEVVVDDVFLVRVRPASERPLAVVQIDGNTGEVLHAVLQALRLTGHVEVVRCTGSVRLVHSDPLRHAVCTTTSQSCCQHHTRDLEIKTRTRTSGLESSSRVRNQTGLYRHNSQ